MDAQRYFAGIDSGSTASKCVIIDQQGEIVSKGLYSLGAGTAGPETAYEKALSDANLQKGAVVNVCSTGYGRQLVKWAGMQRSELSCHALGASFLFPGAHTIIDIGGQDAKVLRVGDNGQLENFVMNDKCAAGTGRFLDVMASIFGSQVADLSMLDREAKRISPISSTCTVFAESEVISKLAAGEDVPEVVAGIHESVVERTYGLVLRLGIKPEVAMSGGVSLNEALRQRLERRIGYPIATSSLAQYNGALGAAYFARNEYVDV